jgi:hypothetical protein
LIGKGRDSLVGTATVYSLEIRDLNPGGGRRFSLFYTDPDRPSNPQGLFPEVKVQDVALTIYSI